MTEEEKQPSGQLESGPWKSVLAKACCIIMALGLGAGYLVFVLKSAAEKQENDRIEQTAFRLTQAAYDDIYAPYRPELTPPQIVYDARSTRYPAPPARATSRPQPPKPTTQTPTQQITELQGNYGTDQPPKNREAEHERAAIAYLKSELGIYGIKTVESCEPIAGWSSQYRTTVHWRSDTYEVTTEEKSNGRILGVNQRKKMKPL